MSRKPVVLFIGAHFVPKGGEFGGQLAACRQLRGSPVGDVLEWRLLDATMRSVPPPGPAVRLWFAASRVAKTLWELLTHRIDVVLVFASYTHLRLVEKTAHCLLGQLFRKRVVISFRSEVRRYPRWRWLNELIPRLTVWACDAVICQSQRAKDALEQVVGPCPRAVVVQNWIDARPFDAIAASRKPREAGEIATILYIGWLEPFKGIFTLAEAVAKLHAAGQSVRVLFAGSGSAHDALAARCRELGIERHADLLGWVVGEQKLAALAAADIFALPSDSEGMPNAVMEAMACQLPVVATRVGGIPSLVDDGEGGFLVPPRDADALADALGAILDNPQRGAAMGAVNRARILQRHDIARLWPRVAEVITGQPVAPSP